MRDTDKVCPVNAIEADGAKLISYDEVKKSVVINTQFYGVNSKKEDIELTKLYPNSMSVAINYILLSVIYTGNQYKNYIDFGEIEKFYKENEKYILLRFPVLNDYETEDRVETFFFEAVAQVEDKLTYGNEIDVQNDELYNFINKRYNIIKDKFKK